MSLVNIKELLSTNTGTEGSLLIVRKIHDTIIDEAQKALIPRDEASLTLGPSDITGSSYDLNRLTPNTMSARLIPEGTDIAIDQVEYTNLNIKPKKYGVAIRITRELMEDSKFNILQNQIGFAGKRLAENENTLVITALDTAANTVSGGVAITIANITRAMQYVEEADYEATSLFVGTEVANDIRSIDTFTEVSKFGSNEMLSKGFVGTILGMKVMRVSTNAGMTTTSSYVTDKTQAYVIAEKRPITVEGFMLPAYDMEAASITQRIAVSALRTSAIAKITTS